MKRARSESTAAAATKYPRSHLKARRMSTVKPSYAAHARLSLARRGLLTPEKKFYDTSLVGSALTAPTDATGGEHDPATVLTISAPAQGTTEQQRVGRSILITTVDIQGNCAIPSTSAKTTLIDLPNIMIALVLDTQTNGAQLNSEDVFKNMGADASLAVQAFRNMSNTPRFKVLAKRLLKFETVSATNNAASNTITQHGCFIPWDIHLKLALPVKFSVGSTAAGVASVEDNSLHIVAFCNDVGYAPEISYGARIRYTDA